MIPLTPQGMPLKVPQGMQFRQPSADRKYNPLQRTLVIVNYY